jgi:predicted N-acetyltransferase YhbS
MSEWTLRPERASDEAAIAAVVTAAFADHPHSAGSEAFIVQRLRDAGELTLSLMAHDPEGTILAHVAFSPVSTAAGVEGWYGLGPVSVIPARQREGIGSALIRDGLARLEALGAAGCVVLGEPAYYGRFGFAHDPALTYPGPPPRYFQRLLLRGENPRGEVRYSAAFG